MSILLGWTSTPEAYPHCNWMETNTHSQLTRLQKQSTKTVIITENRIWYLEWECEKLLTVEDSFMELGALSPAMTIETEFERERESWNFEEESLRVKDWNTVRVRVSEWNEENSGKTVLL